MYTTIDDQGRLNNYATEPKIYLAAYPSPEQQQQYARQAAMAVLLLGSLLLTAFAVS
jgi:hypothetical protein